MRDYCLCQRSDCLLRAAVKTSGRGSPIGPLGRGETRASIPLGAAAPPAVRHTSLRAPNPPAQARTHHRGTRGPTEAHRARSRAARPPPYHPEAPCYLPYRPCRPQVPNGPRWNSPALSIAIPVLGSSRSENQGKNQETPL